MDLDFPEKEAVKVSMIKYVNKLSLLQICQQRINYFISEKKVIQYS